MPPKRQGSSSASLGVADAFQTLASSYRKSTPARIKLIDAFLLFLVATGVAQFLYCVLISDYPFNSFLAGYVQHGAPLPQAQMLTCALQILSLIHI